MKQKLPHKDRKILHPLVITINLMLILFLGNAFSIGFVGNAQDTSGNGEAAPPPLKFEGNKAVVNELLPGVCVSEMTKFADPEFENYKTFMEQNFLNKSKTNDLLELGMKRYEKFKADILGKLSTLIPEHINTTAQNQGTAALQLPALALCEAKAREYIENAGQMLEMRAVATSNLKQATLFVEKYKQINGKLGALNMDVMKMVNNITAFEQKLPCYLKSCI